MIHSGTRDKGSQGTGIKHMADEPSRDELLEKARVSLRRVVGPWPAVLEHLTAIKDRKKSGRVEHGKSEELLTLDFADLIRVIADTGSRVVDVGYEVAFWNLLIEGTTNLGVTLQVGVRLAKAEGQPLQIAFFQMKQA